MNSLQIIERRTVSVLTSELAEQVRRMRMRYAMWEANCLRFNGDHGPRSQPESLPRRLNVERNRIYVGIGAAGTYNHQAQLARFKGRYYCAFSNCAVDEDDPGQRTMVASSSDAIRWDRPVCAADGNVQDGMLRNTSGLYADDRHMVLYVMTKWRVGKEDTSHLGMTRLWDQRVRIDAYTTTDASKWAVNEGIVAGKDIWLFEAPRPTQDGHLLAAGSVDGFPVAYLWQANSPDGKPEIVPMPKPDAEARLADGEGSWYQTDAGKIVMFWRDGGASERLYVTASDDNGRTWMKPLCSDFPDSMSRVYAGRLPDGRFYLIGNAYAKLLDRTHLMLALSDDGLKFNRIYGLLEDPTEQRATGLLKCHGYQYPCALAEEGRLLVAYSVNKEDVECGVVRLSDLS